ncbi:UNKNOWN [Stylonychia lemnae]|uniref:Uncharacterized protein n=1 Tax=Stylonychia lemnae TaxID=5949 RepID=A0A078A2M3_STYLE|nr:UNKNOWN [Stylonychia lemnae]|eukprot:CDW76077.1 UNKNOWN [Stylonychia lemnae]
MGLKLKIQIGVLVQLSNFIEKKIEDEKIVDQELVEYQKQLSSRAGLQNINTDDKTSKTADKIAIRSRNHFDSSNPYQHQGFTVGGAHITELDKTIKGSKFHQRKFSQDKLKNEQYYFQTKTKTQELYRFSNYDLNNEEIDFSQLEKYQSTIDNNALVWQENEIRNTDTVYQKMNYEAIRNKKDQFKRRTKIV